MSNPKEWWIAVSKYGRYPTWLSSIALNKADFAGKVNNPVHVIEYAAYQALEARVRELEGELATWKKIEEASGRTRSEIYGMSYQLKKGEYKPPLPDIPVCSMAPESVKIHDDICDIFDARAFNEHDVCTASTGIWAAIGVCEKLWRDKVKELEAEVERLRKKQELVCNCATLLETHGPILCDACKARKGEG